MSGKIALQPAYVLHTRGYRDTSLLVEALTAEFGRIALIARGARSGKVRTRAVLQPFRGLLLSWAGRGDVFTLTGVEESGPAWSLDQRVLASGFYMNELLIRLTQRNDPNVGLFHIYSEALGTLNDAEAVERTLRIFEKRLLDQLGYGLVLGHEAGEGAPISAGQAYQYHVEHGAIRVGIGAASGNQVLGSTLLSLEREELRDRRSLEEAKRLMRQVLAHYLGPAPLRSRELLSVPGR